MTALSFFRRLLAGMWIVFAGAALIATHYFDALVYAVLAYWIWAYDSADRERTELRRTRTITHTVEVHQRPGESAEHLARRVVDECRRRGVWTKS